MSKKDFTKLIQEDVSSIPSMRETVEDGLERRKIEGTKRLKGARLIAIERIRPDPNQPRRRANAESLHDLIQSVREHGVLQPIAVEYQSDEDYYRIVNGERRWRAAKEAGLNEIPCIERTLDEETRMVHQLVENLQREDLNPIEEAEGYRTLVEHFGYTHEQLAKSVGKSRSVITESLSLNNLPDSIKAECRTSDNYAKSILLQVVRQPSSQEMLNVWQEIKGGNLTVREVRAKSKRKSSSGRPRPFQFKYQSPNQTFTLRLQFRKGDATKSEIIQALSEALQQIQNTE